jgi:hypothetical protein
MNYFLTGRGAFCPIGPAECWSPPFLGSICSRRTGFLRSNPGEPLRHPRGNPSVILPAGKWPPESAISPLRAIPKPPGGQAVGNRNGILALRYRYGCLPLGHRVAWGWLAGGFWQAWGRPERQPDGERRGTASTMRLSHERERAASPRINNQPDRAPPHWLKPPFHA